MARSELLATVTEFLFPGRFSHSVIAPLDAGLTPNDRLEKLDGRVIDGLDEPDDAVLLDDGSVVVAAGKQVVRIGKQDDRSVVATLPGPAGPLAQGPDGSLIVGVAGHGVLRISFGGELSVLCAEAGGSPLHCPTDLAVLDDGAILVTDGSTRHHGDRWVHDLMEQNALGRLIRHDPATDSTTVLRSDLAYPAGVTVTADQSQVIVSEAWTHQIRSVHLDSGADDVRCDNLPLYPGRLSVNDKGNLLLAAFALRTQLVDFVLTQRDYAEEMMRTIEPDYWIRPTLRGLDSGLEPLQGGQIRKLGVIKPWAPPRSYGLAVELDVSGRPLSSIHSRGGGRRHGVTSVRQFGSEVLVVVRGGRQLIVTTEGVHP